MNEMFLLRAGLGFETMLGDADVEGGGEDVSLSSFSFGLGASMIF